MPQGSTGDIRQTVWESTSQRETRAPDSQLVVVSNGMEGGSGRQCAHLCERGHRHRTEGKLRPWARGLHLTAWSYWPGLGGMCFLTWEWGMGGCGWQQETVKDHTESRTGDSNTARTGRWPLWAAAAGFPRNGQDSIWWGRAAPAASDLPVWCSVTRGREVVANARTISGHCCFFHCLPSSLGCDYQRNLHPHLVKWSLANKPSLSPPTLFCCEMIKEARGTSRLMEWRLTLVGNAVFSSRP